MSVPVTLPALGESVQEGTITRWLKQEGDDVQADEPLLEVSTDKVDTEIPAPASGTLLAIKVGADETVAVGTELALIGDAAESQSNAKPDAQSRPAAAPPEPTQEPPASEPTQQSTPSEPAPQAQPAAAADDAPAGGGQGGGDGVSVRLPELGESVQEGTITRWLKQEGDDVQADEPLLEVSTDKVDTEIPAPASGTLLAIKVQADETVAVGTELAVIGAGASAPSAQRPAPQPEPPAEPAPPAPADSAQSDGATDDSAADDSALEQSGRSDYATPEELQVGQLPPQEQAGTRAEAGQSPAAAEPTPAGGTQPAYVTPLVRKLATEHGVDLATLTGTGVGGRIRKQDVLDAAGSGRGGAPSQPAVAPREAPQQAPEQGPQQAPAGQPAPPAPRPAPVRGRTEKMSRLRQLIATRLVESLQSSAQLTTVVEADITRIARLRQRAKKDFEARQGTRLSFLPFFAVAAVEALKEHPKLNATIDSEKMEITYNEGEHLGIAVDTERGLLVPVIRNAGDLNIGGLARKIAELAARTRENKIGPDELGGGTFTLTNTGSRGALFDTPIINQPQVAILGTGSVVKRPVVVDDPDLGETIAVRSMVYLALTYDHRLVDGADAARFLVTVKDRLEEGDFEAQLRG